MRRPTLLASLLLLCAAPAFAQDDAEPDCANAVTQADIDACANVEFEKVDAELNAAYKIAVTRLEQADEEFAEVDANAVGAVEALKKAQRAWIAYRDASCELAGFGARSGTLENTLYIDCTAELTRRRTKELQALLEEEWLN